MKYQHIIRAILARPWAIDPESLAWSAVLDVLALRASGDVLSDAEIEARIAAAGNGPRAGRSSDRNVAIIPVYGVISPRQSMMARSSGGTTAESILSDFRAALRDPEVDGIVLDIDSPGGVVEGIGELADEIRAARGTKPIAAVANHMMASAAYWLGAAADEIVATPSASVGSIGVFTAHQDVSAAMEREGVKTTLISAGKHKVEGNQYEPLGDEARAAIQSDVDAWYATMTQSIARSRGIPVDQVRGEYGEGRTLLARKALERGMVDRIDSLENTIRRVARGAVGPKPKTTAIGGMVYHGVDLAAGDDYTLLSLTDGSGNSIDFDQAAAGSAPADTFTARILSASEEVRAIGIEARNRAAVRRAEGRDPSPSTLLALAHLMGSLEELEEEPEAIDPADPGAQEPTGTAAVRGDLEVIEAALRGGYRIP